MLILFLFLILNNCNCLTPGSLPNGNIKKYIPNNEFPHEDLRIIQTKKAMLITNNWLENIINNILADELVTLKFFKETEDTHIITKIKNLDKKIKNNSNNLEHILLVWMPKCKYGSDDVLSIIYIEFNDKNFNVCQVIPSPFWNSEQIKSIELKKSLLNFGKNNTKVVNFNELFENDFRYKLSWSTWDIK